MDEGSATVAKDALHNYKLDGENKIKVRVMATRSILADASLQLDHVRKEVNLASDGTVVPAFEGAITVLCISPFLLDRFSLYHHDFLTLLMLKYPEIHNDAWPLTDLELPMTRENEKDIDQARQIFDPPPSRSSNPWSTARTFCPRVSM
jgi:hypothetical protein